jgi:integrase
MPKVDQKRPWAEKRGNKWRSRWPIPGAPPGGKSGFATEVDALTHGWEQLGIISRDGVPVDTSANSDMTVKEWTDAWYKRQTLEETTMQDYRNIIELRILPYFADRTIRSLDGATDEIDQWENELVTVAGYAPTTAAAARSKFGTILTDAIKKLKLTIANPCPRPRNRGRKAARVIARPAQKRWANALEMLLVAERCAALSRDDTDFVLVVTIFYCGLRWGEAIGLERDAVHDTGLDVVQQLNEFGGHFKRRPPKEGSYRYEDYEQNLIAVDNPPFLQALLHDQARRMAGLKCTCNGIYSAANPGCDGRAYLFLSPTGAHFRRNNFGENQFRPAANGMYPGQSKKTYPRPAKPVLVDAAEPYPGRPLRPAWPAAVPGEEYTAPFGRSAPRVDTGTALATWLPVKSGLTPHSGRHAHKTWMTELGVPEVLQAKRLGHAIPGMRGVYTHIAPETRAACVAALQARWEQSLRDRCAISPHSAVPLLDRLLQGVAEKPLPVRSQLISGGAHLHLV